MTHTQNVFLVHYLTATALFWCFCQYQSIKQKKARQRRHANEQKRTIHMKSITHLAKTIQPTFKGGMANEHKQGASTQNRLLQV